MSEPEFWSSTPSKIYELAMIHAKVNSINSDSKQSKGNGKSGYTWYEVLD